MSLLLQTKLYHFEENFKMTIECDHKCFFWYIEYASIAFIIHENIRVDTNIVLISFFCWCIEYASNAFIIHENIRVDTKKTELSCVRLSYENLKNVNGSKDGYQTI